MICGIDPGSTGAIAWLSDDGHLICVEDLPTVQVKVSTTMRTRMVPVMLSQMLIERRPTHVFLEETNAMGKNGAISNYQLGNNAGQVEGVLAGLGIAMTFVKPTMWKKHFGLKGGPENKGASRLHAMRLWPGCADRFKRAMDSDRAEAALIGLYATARMHGVAESAGPMPQLRRAVPVAPLVRA